MNEKRILPAKLEDLAKILGVSKVTVSKALRNHPDISEETTSRVKALAEKLGYRPNINARNLSARKSNIIGLVVPKIAHFFFGSVIEAVFSAAHEKGYETVMTVSQELAEREKQHIESLISMRVDGLIVSITEQTKDYSIFKRAIEMNIPMVFVDRVPEIPDVPSVTVDDYGGAYSAVEYFIQKGYTKIGLVGGFEYINIGKARNAGFFDAMKKHNAAINPSWIKYGGFGEEDGYKAFKELLQAPELPEAILAVTYPVALGMYEAASEAGIRIPKDINVTCFGNNVFKYMAPSVFNYVDQPTQELGTAAVSVLYDIMNNPDNEFKRQIELPTRLLINGRNVPTPSLLF